MDDRKLATPHLGNQSGEFAKQSAVDWFLQVLKQEVDKGTGGHQTLEPGIHEAGVPQVVEPTSTLGMTPFSWSPDKNWWLYINHVPSSLLK